MRSGHLSCFTLTALAVAGCTSILEVEDPFFADTSDTETSNRGATASPSGTATELGTGTDSDTVVEGSTASDPFPESQTSAPSNDTAVTDTVTTTEVGTATQRQTHCGTDADCNDLQYCCLSSDLFCDAEAFGTCVDRAAQGESCEDPRQCPAKLFCTQGVCCESQECGGPCETCAAFGHEGVCHRFDGACED
jgi:hypothetical protein